MIDILLMLVGICISGYSFYRSMRMLSEVEHHKIPRLWRISFKLVPAFVLAVLFVLTFFLFGLYSVFDGGLDFLKIVMGLFFLSAAIIVALTVKVNSLALRNAVKGSETFRRMYEDTSRDNKELQQRIADLRRELEKAKSSGDGKGMESKIRGLQAELQAAKEISNKAVKRELRMVELKKEIKRLKEHPKDKSK